MRISIAREATLPDRMMRLERQKTRPGGRGRAANGGGRRVDTNIGQQVHDWRIAVTGHCGHRFTMWLRHDDADAYLTVDEREERTSLANAYIPRGLRHWTHSWRRALEDIKPHYVSLSLVLLACAIGQIAIMKQPIYIVQPSDAANYLAVERHILTIHQFADPLRTPGYPAFLALISALGGGERYHHIMLAQAGLMVLAAIEVYMLAFRLGGRRWSACLLAALIGANLYSLDWERLVLTETLSYWLIVTVLLVLERFLRTGRTTLLVWLAILCAAAILTRPIFILLPVVLVLVLVVWSARSGKLQQIWKGLALVLALSYGLTLAYMAVNFATYGYFGLSDIGSLNLFAKVLELHRTFGMPVSGAGPGFAQFQQDVDAYVSTGQSDVWAFVHTHARWDAHYWSIYGTYSVRVLASHPWYFVQGAARDVWNAWMIQPRLWAQFTTVPPWIATLMNVSILQAWAYWCLPFLLVALPIRLWRRPGQTTEAVLVAMLMFVVSQILMAGALDFTEYDRLRFPVDWAMTSITWIVALDLIAGAAGALYRRAATRRSKAASLSDAVAVHPFSHLTIAQLNGKARLVGHVGGGCSSPLRSVEHNVDTDT